MLTMRDLLLAADITFASPLSTKALLHNPTGKPLSIARWISAYGIQRRVYFIQLLSIGVLSPAIQTYEELIRRLSLEMTPLRPDEVKAFAKWLNDEHGILLRFVERGGSHSAALVGTVESFTNLSVLPLSTPVMRDNSQAMAQAAQNEAAAQGLAAAMLMGLGTIGFTKGGFALVGLGFILGLAAATKYSEAARILREPHVWVEDRPPDAGTDTGAPDAGTDTGAPDAGTDTGAPDAGTDTGAPDAGTDTGAPDAGPHSMLDPGSDVPDAVVVGDPPDGVNVDGVFDAVLDYSKDMGLLDLPTGWDSDQRVELPNYGMGGDGREGGVPERTPGGSMIPPGLGWTSRHNNPRHRAMAMSALTGTVTDAANKPVFNSRVDVVLSSGKRYTTFTNQQGAYRLSVATQGNAEIHVANMVKTVALTAPAMTVSFQPGATPLQPADVLAALQEVGVGFSVPEAKLRDWLSNAEFTPYPAMAQALLALLRPRPLRQPVPIDVIVSNYEQTPGAASPRKVGDVDQNVLKKAILEGYNERHLPPARSFEETLR